MEFYFALVSLVILVGLLIYFNNKMYSAVMKEVKKLKGDAQQIKTAQRAERKREVKIIKRISKRKAKFDF